MSLITLEHVGQSEVVRVTLSLGRQNSLFQVNLDPMFRTRTDADTQPYQRSYESEKCAAKESRFGIRNAKSTALCRAPN